LRIRDCILRIAEFAMIFAIAERRTFELLIAGVIY